MKRWQMCLESDGQVLGKVPKEVVRTSLNRLRNKQPGVKKGITMPFTALKSSAELAAAGAIYAKCA